MTLRKILCFLSIFLILAAAAVFQNIYITNTSSHLMQLTQRLDRYSHSGDLDGAKTHYEMLTGEFKKVSGVYRALLDHSFICDVNEQLYILGNAVEAESPEQICTGCASLEYALLCIYDLETVAVDNIF